MINISPATLTDVPAIEAIYRELFATMADLQPDYYLNASQNREFIEGLINVQETGLFFAEKEGNPLGFLIVQQQKTPPYSCITPHNFAYIMDLAVTEDSRGLGIGTKLINAAIEWAKEKKLDYVELGVLSNNEGARKLYEKLGFEDVTQLMRYKLTK